MMTFYSDPATPPVIGYEDPGYGIVRILHTEEKRECGIPDCPCHAEEAERRAMLGDTGKIGRIEREWQSPPWRVS